MPGPRPIPPSRSRSGSSARITARDSYRAHQLTLGSPPPHPLGSPLIQVLRAVIDGEVGSWELAWTTILRVVDRQERLDRLTMGEPDDPRVLLDHEDGLVRLFGSHDQAGHWVPGLAGLTERQARFVELQLAGYTASQISFLEGRRKGPMLAPLDLATVYSTISQGKAKLRQLLAPYYGFPASEESAEVI